MNTSHHHHHHLTSLPSSLVPAMLSLAMWSFFSPPFIATGFETACTNWLVGAMALQISEMLGDQ